MSKDYRTRIGVSKNPTTKEVERYQNCRFVKGKLRYTDMFIKHEDNAFDTIDIILNNSSYQYQDLKKMYVVDVHKILKKIKQRLRKQNK